MRLFAKWEPDSIVFRFRFLAFAMRIPLTKYGWPQVVVFPAVVLTLMVASLLGAIAFLPLWAIISIEALWAVVLIWALAFLFDCSNLLTQLQNPLFF